MSLKINLRDHIVEISSHSCEIIIILRRASGQGFFPTHSQKCTCIHMIRFTQYLLNIKLCDRQLFQSLYMYFFLHIYQNLMRKFYCLHFSDHAERSNILNQDSQQRIELGLQCSSLAFNIGMLPCSVQSEQITGVEILNDNVCCYISFFPFS